MDIAALEYAAGEPWIVEILLRWRGTSRYLTVDNPCKDSGHVLYLKNESLKKNSGEMNITDSWC